jgi:hypothetical protein
MPDLLLLAGTAGIVATSVLLVTALRLASPVSFVLGVFAVAWAVTIAETMLLGVAGLWTRGWMLVAIGTGLGLSLTVWQLASRPRPPSFASAVSEARAALRDPLLAVMALASAAAIVYAVVVALAIPPFDIDVLAYHLPRIVLWMQQHAVAAIPDAPGSNLNANPPGAEIVQGFTMLVAETDRYAALMQVACVPAGALAVAGIGRRIGLDLRASLFGGLLFTAFPIVALQGPTTLNDLAVATGLVVACFFALGTARGELVLCALALALALSTKISGILGLPSVALLALVAVPAGRRLRVVVAGAAGCALGSWWYVYNLARTGAWDGHLGSDYGQIPSRAPDDVFLRLERYGLQTLDLAGVVGRDRWLFPLVACVLAAAVFLAWRSNTRRAAGFLGAACLVAVAPWLIDQTHVLAVRAIARSWIEVGRHDVIGDIPLHAEARPFPGETWFGPVFAIALVAAVIVVWRTTSGRHRTVLFTALVFSPALLYLVNASAFVYDGARGRFFVIAGAFSATGFGVLLRVRPIAWATAVIATLTLALSFVHYHARPLGIRLFQPLGESTAWGEPRWFVQTSLAPSADARRSARLIEQLVPPRAVVAVEADPFVLLYPLMGAGPWRTIRLVPPDGRVPEDAEFLAIEPRTHASPPRAGWTKVPGIATWDLYERAERST